MMLIIDHNLKQAEFTLFDAGNGKPSAAAKRQAPMDSALEPGFLDPLIRDMASAGPLDSACVRLRFGGDLFNGPARVDKAFLETYAGLTPHFPFYIPLTHAFLKRLLASLNHVPLHAFFETALFCGLPEQEKIYAVPREYNEKLGLRRFGYHGLFHGYHADRLDVDGTVLSVVLDKQTTVCAIENGKPSYISVGYTPLEGVMGRTSCGDLDPGVAFYLLRERRESFYGIDNLLKKKSGFRGLTGFDLEIGDLYRHAGDEPKVKRAFNIYFNQVLRHMGAALAVSGPLSGLVFGGRFVSDLEPVAYRLAKKLTFLGVSLKALPWEKGDSGFDEVSDPGSRVRVALNRETLPEVLCESALEAVKTGKIIL